MRTLTLLILLSTSFAVLAAPAASKNAGKPNIVLIIADQHTADAMSGAGYGYVKTPALDSLAATGVRFRQTYCTYPVCMSSRASLMTGRWPHELTGGDDEADAASTGKKSKGKKGGKKKAEEAPKQ